MVRTSFFLLAPMILGGRECVNGADCFIFLLFSLDKQPENLYNSLVRL